MKPETFNYKDYEQLLADKRELEAELVAALEREEALLKEAEVLRSRMMKAEMTLEEKSEEEPVLYMCDRRACDNCTGDENGCCSYTTDIRHAENFWCAMGRFIEKGIMPDDIE